MAKATQQVERRFVSSRQFPIRIEQRGEGEAAKPVIVGYAAVFYDPADAGTEYKFSGWWDEFVERIMPGAFDRAIREDDVRALFNHNPDHLLGRSTAATLRLSVDKKGLRYEIDPPDTGVGGQVLVNIGRSELTGSSFAFGIGEQVWREVKQEDDSVLVIREIHQVEPLYDVGPVTYPAYESTTAGVRAFRSAHAVEDLQEARKSYEAWKTQRAEGRSRAEAMRRRARALEVGSEVI